MNPMEDPRPNNNKPLNPSHERVPIMCKLVQIPTAKTVRIAKTQIGKIRQGGARQNAVGMRKLAKTGRGSRNPKKVDPGWRAIRVTQAAARGSKSATTGAGRDDESKGQDPKRKELILREKPKRAPPPKTNP